MTRVETIKGCCEDFTRHINRKCDHPDHGFECPDNVVRLYVSPNKKNIHFGLQHPDGLSYYIIKCCPWCGANIEELAKQSIQK